MNLSAASPLRTPAKEPAGASLDTRTIEAILTKVATADSMADLEAKDKDLVLVVGNTGAGKSTFLNYLIGKRMIEDRVKGSMMKGFRCEDPQFEIGFGFESKTQFPEVYFDHTSGLTYCDCPGFNDNRGVDFDISNMYAIARLVDSARSIKCIVMLDFNSLLSDRSSSLLSIIGICEKLFGERNLRNVGLIISKAPYTEDRKEIVEFLMNNPLQSSIFELSTSIEMWERIFRDCIVYDPSERNGCRKESILSYIRGLCNVTLGIRISTESELFLLSLIVRFSSEAIETLSDAMKQQQTIHKLTLLTKLHVFAAASSNLARQFQSVNENLSAEFEKLAVDNSNEFLLRSYIKDLQGTYRDLVGASLQSLQRRREERERLLRQERELREAAQRERERREREERERQEQERKMREAIQRERERLEQEQRRQQAQMTNEERELQRFRESRRYVIGSGLAPDGGPLYFHGGGFQASGMTRAEFELYGARRVMQMNEWRRQGWRWDQYGNIISCPRDQSFSL